MVDSHGQSRSHTEFSAVRAVRGVWAARRAEKVVRPTGQMAHVGDPNRWHTTVAGVDSAGTAVQAIGREGPPRGESTPHITLTSTTLIPVGAVAEATRATPVQGSGGITPIPGERVANEMVNAELPSNWVQVEP